MQLVYLTLFIRVLINEGAVWKKAVNVMILIDEGIKLLATIGTLVGVVISSIWVEMNEMPESNFMGNSPYCKFYIILSFGVFWSVIGSAGKSFLVEF